MSRRPVSRLQSTILLTVLTAISSNGTTSAIEHPQEPAPAETQQSTSETSSDEPPVITFAPEGLGVVEAVRLALLHDPNLQIAETEVQRQEGVAQEQRGPFDMMFNALASYTHRIQELTETRKEDERRRRRNLQQNVDAHAQDRDEADVLLRRLETVRTTPPGSEQVRQITEINPVIGTQLEVIDELIASADPSERAELLRIRNGFINETTTRLQSDLEQAVDLFDRDQQRLRDLGEAPTDEVFYDALLRFELSRLFRTGIAVAPFVEGTAEGTNFKDKARSRDFGGKGVEDLFTARAGINLLVPLARGRGADATAAGERAAGAELGASRLAFVHERAVTVLTTIRAYWGLRAAQDATEIARRSVALHEEVLEATERLVLSDELPALEQSRARASAARANARLRDAERTQHEARVGLATVLGLDTTGDDATLPAARDAFPELPVASALEGWLQQVPDEAIEERRDLAAARQREEAGAILERGAVTNLRPRLDLTVSSWYTALAERSASDALDRWVGPSATFQLEYEKPLGNNTAKGQLLAREAERRQRQILAGDTRRQIALGVVRTTQSLVEALARVEQAEAAVTAYATTVAGEVDRFQAGEATLIDTLLTEQQRIDAELAYVAARQEAAALVAELRFESATLVSADAAPDLDTLISVPTRGGGSLP